MNNPVLLQHLARFFAQRSAKDLRQKTLKNILCECLSGDAAKVHA
jgi:hypothetical protein